VTRQDDCAHSPGIQLVVELMQFQQAKYSTICAICLENTDLVIISIIRHKHISHNNSCTIPSTYLRTRQPTYSAVLQRQPKHIAGGLETRTFLQLRNRYQDNLGQDHRQLAMNQAIEQPDTSTTSSKSTLRTQPHNNFRFEGAFQLMPT
jgi:hypothetical protein